MKNWTIKTSSVRQRTTYNEVKTTLAAASGVLGSPFANIVQQLSDIPAQGRRAPESAPPPKRESLPPGWTYNSAVQIEALQSEALQLQQISKL